MARKSNKTAHVLNLLSGHDTKKEPEKELETDLNLSNTVDILKKKIMILKLSL